MNKALEIAFSHCGVKETVGSKHNPVVVDFFKTVGHSWVKDDETAWCAAFVGHCLEKAGYGSTRKLNARSYLEYGKITDDPQLGDIAVLWRINPNSSYGHVAFVINPGKDTVHLYGGNQGNKVGISEYPKNRVLAYIKVNR